MRPHWDRKGGYLTVYAYHQDGRVAPDSQLGLLRQDALELQLGYVVRFTHAAVHQLDKLLPSKVELTAQGRQVAALAFAVLGAAGNLRKDVCLLALVEEPKIVVISWSLFDPESLSS